MLSIILLLALFVIGASFAIRGGHQAVPDSLPSSLNPRSAGNKALFLLYRRLGFSVGRLETNWDSAGNNTGLLIVIEPLDDDRLPSKSEASHLANWIRKGGVLLYAVTLPARPVDSKDPIAGDLAIEKADDTLSASTPNLSDSPLLANVKSITVQSPVRLIPSPAYRILFSDNQGPVTVEKNIGKGGVIVVSDNLLLSNGGIAQADNALFLSNIAAAYSPIGGKKILFDEYHHGVGLLRATNESSQGLWSSAPVPIRLALLYLLALTILAIYSANQRLGLPKTMDSRPYRPSSDYVSAVAGLHRRAGAADLPLKILAHGLKNQLCTALDLPLDAKTDQIVHFLSLRESLDASTLGTLLDRCETLSEKNRPSELDMLETAVELETWRRRIKLVGS